MTPARHIDTVDGDVAVIGAGAAGLYAAVVAEQPAAQARQLLSPIPTNMQRRCELMGKWLAGADPILRMRGYPAAQKCNDALKDADLLKRLGMNVDFVATDWGTAHSEMKNELSQEAVPLLPPTSISRKLTPARI